MGQPLSYEPESTNNIAALAARENRDPREVVYELMLEKMAGLSFGMTDRGTLEPGTKADVNVIDYGQFACQPPGNDLRSARRYAAFDANRDRV